ncbi:MAG: nucleotidyl transferase AbiEii/AbiGii toxin family protein [Gemmatimonadetes bacterium]|nr:nucleotidyl transferase AbiEii/AbiGii toxin family protein [Gemmatimonadota bacterium]
MIGDNHSLTPGYVARHVPRDSPAGPDVAVLDIAQDFLLAHLQECGVFEQLAVFKGGTALRKLFAGARGRFSTDLDFAAAEVDADRQTLAQLVARESDVTLGPFRFRPSESRGRWRISVSSSLGDPAISIKVDVGPPCWLEPELRPFVPVSTHERYGFRLPSIPTMRLEEILGEKIARLTRTSTARDASDLVWAATTSPHSGFGRDLVRRLAVLKVWVDIHGLRPGWSPALGPVRFEPDAWLSSRESWDDEQIGLLAHRPPSLGQLGSDLQSRYSWLRDLSEEEVRWAAADMNDRGDVIEGIQNLDGGALAEASLW